MVSCLASGQVLEGAIERFHLLKYTLALILIFVGVRMVWLKDAPGGTFPIAWSLSIMRTTGGVVS